MVGLKKYIIIRFIRNLNYVQQALRIKPYFAFNILDHDIIYALINQHLLSLCLDHVKQAPGTLNFFGGCVPHGFPKVRSRERVYLENSEYWEQKFWNFASRELKFWPKTRLKMQNFSKKVKMGARERRIYG